VGAWGPGTVRSRTLTRRALMRPHNVGVARNGTALLARPLTPALTVVASTPVVAWALVGDLRTVAAREPDPDYFFRPVDFPAPLPGLIEGAAALILAIGIAALVWMARRGAVRSRAWIALGLALIAGALLGLFARIMTAAVIGANIGAAFAVLGVFLLVIPLYVASLVVGVMHTTAAKSHATPESPIGRID
jgi:hypothetical protein